jgi:hypothetical protein
MFTQLYAVVLLPVLVPLGGIAPEPLLAADAAWALLYQLVQLLCLGSTAGASPAVQAAARELGAVGSAIGAWRLSQGRGC